MSRLLIATLVLLVPGVAAAQDPSAGEAHPRGQTAEISYSASRIDIGLVVSDLDDAVAFYEGALGLQRAYSFDVPAEFAREAGLTSGDPLHAVALKLTGDPDAPVLKLVQTGEPEVNRPEFITDRSGVRYLTVNVAALAPLLERLQERGVVVLGNGPVQMGNGQHLALVQDPDGVFIELIGPMHGASTP